MADVISKTINTQIRKKLSDGTYQVEHPETTIENVLGKATQAEAEAGTSTNKYMTPLRTSEHYAYMNGWEKIEDIQLKVDSANTTFSNLGDYKMLKIFVLDAVATNPSDLSFRINGNTDKHAYESQVGLSGVVTKKSRTDRITIINGLNATINSHGAFYEITISGSNTAKIVTFSGGVYAREEIARRGTGSLYMVGSVDTVGFMGSTLRAKTRFIVYGHK